MSLDSYQDHTDDDFNFSEVDVWGDIEPVQKPEFLGMTPGQRFVLAFLLFLTAVILSSFCLLVAGKIALPF
jgi:hypothetical protein